VLYGSQTGNSEQAAIDICNKIPEQLSNSKLSAFAGGKELPPINLTARHMQLDDFLEVERAKWTRLIVIVTSSYGVGQAPLGCQRFREFCDAILSRPVGDGTDRPMLNGVTYALLGLGDSKYTTFFQNPTKIDEALQLAGATRVGKLGKADASGKGDDEQAKVISRWVDEIWPVLAKVVSSEPPSNDTLEQACSSSIEICGEIIPDFVPTPKKSVGVIQIAIPVIMAAIAAFYFTTK